MSNKIKAALFVALYTVGLVLGIGLIQIMLNYLQPTLAEVGATFAVLLFAYAVKMMYDLRLGQLEARDRLNEIANK
jgi:ABC-type Fe3+ transport system permease subunit